MRIRATPMMFNPRAAMISPPREVMVFIINGVRNGFKPYCSQADGTLIYQNRQEGQYNPHPVVGAENHRKIPSSRAFTFKTW